MNKKYIGIDNGVSGSIGFYSDTAFDFCAVPVKKCLNYTKVKKWINRIDVTLFEQRIVDMAKLKKTDLALVVMERPMVNPTRFQATISAVRCLEAITIVLEKLNLPYMFIDSKQWQKDMLPAGIHTSAELKKASAEVGKRLFPSLKTIKKDADSILIAKWAHSRKL